MKTKKYTICHSTDLGNIFTKMAFAGIAAAAPYSIQVRLLLFDGNIPAQPIRLQESLLQRFMIVFKSEKKIYKNSLVAATTQGLAGRCCRYKSYVTFCTDSAAQDYNLHMIKAFFQLFCLIKIPRINQSNKYKIKAK